MMPAVPTHVVGYVVRSGNGFLADPLTDEMVGPSSAVLSAHRFPDLQSAKDHVLLLADRGFGADIVVVTKNGPGPQVPYSTLSAEPSEAETDAGAWIERYAELLRCDPRPGAVAAAIERLQQDIAAATRPETA